jgi:hypothetical protein
MNRKNRLPHVPTSVRFGVYAALVFGVAVLVGASPLFAEETAAASSAPSARIELELEQMRGEALLARLTIANRSQRPLRFRFDTSQRYDLVLLYEGQEAWRWSADKAFAPVAEELVLQPGEKQVFEEQAPLDVFPPFGNTGRCVVHFHLADRDRTGAVLPWQFGEPVTPPASLGTRDFLVDSFSLLAKQDLPHQKRFYRDGNRVRLKGSERPGRVILFWWDGESASNQIVVEVGENEVTTVDASSGTWWNYARAETDEYPFYVEVEVYQK